jgi:hypothetical protein
MVLPASVKASCKPCIEDNSKITICSYDVKIWVHTNICALLSSFRLSSYIEKKNEYSDEKSIALLIASYGVYYIIISSSKLETNLADYKA